MKYLIVALLFASCLRVEKDQDSHLDKEVQELTRQAMFQREYYFEALKWAKKNPDSAARYERKMDSVVTLYKIQLRRYDSLSKIYQEQK